ncbi:MAG: hypothetical protein E7L01_25075 [Paenibacillus macerans]|uniref:Uncharacterized protein n=1 Tax=Paenibacillus macerans TaxID=44252 RepID=A0A6N8EX88_PAEMA|nr:hypothetical protein [Paenibacillus macerans]MBS5909704.1 hypothetical protein [Paenibacillus macerans]MCY7557441.1 hypothetical protein [Paenibacillus macerans]MDU7476587.1 hypothetical protein [Paenibacillus macerans]MEC0137034.1 hypothetical protein [Paenibacillus macerans]MEC0153283.1 hypothetical protein [Paenibacillus macerans]
MKIRILIADDNSFIEFGEGLCLLISWKNVLGKSTVRVAAAALLLTQLCGAAGSVSAAGKDAEVHLCS